MIRFLIVTTTFGLTLWANRGSLARETRVSIAFRLRQKKQWKNYHKEFLL